MLVAPRQVILLIDGGSCMERSSRFLSALSLARSLLNELRDRLVLAALYVEDGILPFCFATGYTCAEVLGDVKIVGGRGCWDRGLLEASRLLVGPATAIIVGCCSAGCEKSIELRAFYDKVHYYCVDRCSSGVVEELRRRGVAEVTCPKRSEARRLGVFG